MIAEGREIAAIHPNMVVKIPMTAEGLKATKVLSGEGIKAVSYTHLANTAWIYRKYATGSGIHRKTTIKMNKNSYFIHKKTIEND